MMLEAVVFFPGIQWSPVSCGFESKKCMFPHNHTAYVSCGHRCNCESPFSLADKLPGRNIIKRKGFVPWSAGSVDLGIIAKLY